MNSPYQRIDLSSNSFNKNEPDNSIPLDVLLYSNYIKYDKLKELTSFQFANSNENTLNIYIDMYTILRPLYKRNLIQNSSIFASMILNLAAHMRAYYWTRHRVATNIYIIMSSNSIVLTKECCMVPEWNITDSFIPNPKRDEILKWNNQLMRLLVPYFPNLYFIEASVESSVIISHLIRTNNNQYPNVILTKDLMCWQIPALDSNTCIFRPRKSKDQDTSFCVNQFNVFNQWKTIATHSSGDSETPLPSDMLSLYIALTSFSARGLKSYYSPRMAINKILELLSEQKIRYGYNSPEAIKKVLLSIDYKKDDYTGSNHITNNLYNRYNMVDLYRLTNIYEQLPESQNRSWDYHKTDPESIREINDKFFINNPIDIIRLMDNPGV